jgi:hypothetical protein
MLVLNQCVGRNHADLANDLPVSVNLNIDVGAPAKAGKRQQVNGDKE